MEEKNNNNQNVNFVYIIRIFLSYWVFYLISGFIFISIGLFYLRYASKTYSVSAKIAIKTDRVNSGGGSNAYVNVNDLMNQEKTYTNEVTYLRSTPLIREVINDMNLFTSYYIKVDKIPKEFHFSLNNIYKNSPFIVIVNEDSPQPLNTLFYLKILDDDRFIIHAETKNVLLYNFKNEELNETQEFFILDGIYKFGQNIGNRYSSFKVLLNSNYKSEEFQGKDLFFKFNGPTLLSYAFQESLSVRSGFYESSIADLTFEWENLSLAEEFLEKLIDKYIEKNLEKKNYNANNTIDYINRQLASISGSLGQSEQQLQYFRTSRDVMNINEKSSNISAQLQNLENSKDDIQTKLQYLSQLNDYFEANKNMATFIPPSFIGMSDATLATLIQELTSLSNERQNLISTNQLRNPRIRTLDANIANIKKAISDNISFSLSATRNELSEVNSRIVDLSNEFATLPQTQRQLIGLEREFNLNDAVYTSLLDKRIQAQIIKASNIADCEIIEPVRYVEISSPSTKKIGLVSLFLGVLFPSIYIVIVNFLSPKIRSSEELSKYSKLPCIGDITHNDTTFSNVVTNNPQSPISERFHSIRSSLIYYMLGEEHKCILITSTLPGEGKSFISLNIATSFASTHNSTVLLGFDLRKASPTLETLKNGKITSGLSAYLINKASLEDITIKTEIPNLDFIPNGEIPPDPVALLSRPRTKELFKELKQKYDYVIVDSPPFGLVTDAFLLMQYSEINIYITRLGVVTKKGIKSTMEDLSSKNIKNIFLLRNDMTKIDKPYFTEYSYKETKRKWYEKLLGLRK